MVLTVKIRPSNRRSIGKSVSLELGTMSAAEAMKLQWKQLTSIAYLHTRTKIHLFI